MDDAALCFHYAHPNFHEIVSATFALLMVIIARYIKERKTLIGINNILFLK